MERTWGMRLVTAVAGLGMGAVGCAADPAGAAGGESQPMTVEGALTTHIDSKDITLDYSALPATAAIVHKINPDPTGMACVPSVKLVAERADGSCKLELEYSVGFAGEGLLLQAARFHAVGGIFQEGVFIQPVPCEGWTTEPYKGGPVVYEKVSGDGTLAMSPIKQPQAGLAKATLKGLFLKPSGEITMKFKGRQFKIDLSQLTFKGDAASQGQTDVACAKTFHDFPAWQLPDIQPKSEGYNATYGLDAFKGKRVVILMGAGWCSSCISQAQVMQKVANQLTAAGRKDFQMVVINDSSAASAENQASMTAKCTFPVFQGSWTVHKQEMAGKTYTAKKNDGFAYDYDGRFMGYYEGAGVVSLNGWETFLNDNLNAPKSGPGTDCRLTGTGADPRVCQQRAE